ncbi:sigma-70 family RNA polymerase sigma factor [Oceanibium sediminis]|uniref:sigma-70 family RNA polymerase sigma factor n=1 Tax=Oceanibium sediminis TaxID=2026339 RepID=UPI000DD37C4D|nr:sigma-70 family RNA polymerase sigma factor [Oceanibium sediminis]
MSNEINQLIARVALRDRAAFAALYDATSAKLYGVCLRILRDKADAEEALQEVYVRVWMNASRFVAAETSPLSWLAAIARNHAIDRIRARKPQSVDIDDAFDLADDAPGPEEAAINASEGGRIERCFDELPEDRAAAVRAAYVEGYSYHELAEQHAVPVNTMRTWLRRSLLKLRACLER